MTDERNAGVLPTSEVVAELAERRASFLGFLERHVGDRVLAEDILQEGLVRATVRADTLRDPAAVVPWFYRVLRNVVADHARQTASTSRALEALAREVENDSDDDAPRAVCRCVTVLAATLKPEYADALRRIEVDGLQVRDFAAASRITHNNAAVRVFRARAALRKRVEESCGACATHGCMDCTCASAP